MREDLGTCVHKCVLCYSSLCRVYSRLILHNEGPFFYNKLLQFVTAFCSLLMFRNTYMQNVFYML